MIQQIGFVGLGAMGLPMLTNLAKEQIFHIHAFDLSEAPFAALSTLRTWGRTLFRADTLDALSKCETVITMLPDSCATNRVIEGGNGAPGLITILRSGATVVDMGSSDPAETMRLVPLLADAGIALVDAPVSGGVAKARVGDLAIMVGGDVAMVERLRPILSRMGQQLIATGKPGAAHAMKALNNYVYAAGLLATVEAVAIAQRLDLDTDIFADVLNNSSGRNFATETKLRPFLLPRNYAGGFALRLQAKDLALADGLQALANVEAPQLHLCAELWAQAAAALPTDADNTEIQRFILARSDMTQQEPRP